LLGVSCDDQQPQKRLLCWALVFSTLFHALLFVAIATLVDFLEDEGSPVFEVTLHDDLREEAGSAPSPTITARATVTNREARNTDKQLVDEIPETPPKASLISAAPNAYEMLEIPPKMSEHSPLSNQVQPAQAPPVPPATPLVAALAHQDGVTLPEAPPRDAVAGEYQITAMKNYYRLIQEKIERQKEYPENARRQNMEGSVTLHFVIERDGNISAINIIKASRFRVLDEAAVATIKRCAPFPIPPAMLFPSPTSFQITLAFKLM